MSQNATPTPEPIDYNAEIDRILQAFGNLVWLACEEHKGWNQDNAKTAISALLVSARKDELRLIKTHDVETTDYIAERLKNLEEHNHA